MAMTLSSGSIAASFDCRVKSTTDLVSTDQSVKMLLNFADALTNGTGADQANQVYTDNQTVTASSRVTYDLAGTLTDYFGNTITFAKIKGILIWNKSTNAVIDVGGGSDGAGTNAFVNWISAAAEEITVNAGGVFMLFDPSATGYAVTATTGDILGINETAGNNCEIDVMLIGTV